jgi:hypothetical protein
MFIFITIFFCHFEKLVKRQAKATAMTYDWLGKYLYWAEIDKDFHSTAPSRLYGTVYRIDLSSHLRGQLVNVETIVSADVRLGRVQSLEFNPFLK